MKRFPILLVLLFGGFLLMGADGCSSDPNVEGAKLYLRNKDYDRAMENIDKALEKDPNNAEALELKGQVLQEQAFATNDAAEHSRLIGEMIAAYERAKEANPEAVQDINNRLSVAYFNEFQRGIQAFNRAQNAEDGTAEFSNAADYFENATMIEPDSSGAYVNQAFALINAQRSEEAIEAFEGALEKGDQSPDTYIYLGDLYAQFDQLEKRVATLETANEMFPGNADVQAQLLNAYVSAGQMDRAMQVYKDAVMNDPSNKLYRYNYGSLLLEAEDYAGAVEQLSEAVKLDPDYGDAQYNLGAAYINQAVAINDQISAMDDDLRANRSSMSESDITATETKMQEMAEQRKALFEKAIPHLEMAKTLFEAEGSDPTGICQALFSAYVQTGQQDKAEALADCTGYDLN